MQFLDNAIAVLFISFAVGSLADLWLRRLLVYSRLSSHYIFKDLSTYESLGILHFRRFLLSTPLHSFNTNIAFSRTRDLKILRKISNHIATAEICHWIGFLIMLGLTVPVWWQRGPAIGISYLACNIVGNLYPCLLQQYNKLRLERLIVALEKRLHSADSHSGPN